MKRLILTAVCLCLLCGCSNARRIVSQNGRYLVSAIGVDKAENGVLISLEAIVINSQDSEQEIKPQVFEADGDNIESAFKAATEKTAKPFDLSHCAIIVLGQDLNSKNQKDIYDFCFRNLELTVSVGFVSAESANTLLKQKPISDITVGYEIVTMLETQYSENKIAFKNRFFEIGNAYLKGEKQKPLPFFAVSGEQYFLVRQVR